MERKLWNCSLQQQLEMSLTKPLPFLMCRTVNWHLLLVKANAEKCPFLTARLLNHLHPLLFKKKCWSRKASLEILLPVLLKGWNPLFYSGTGFYSWLQVCLSLLSSQGRRDSRFSSHSLKSSEGLECILVRKSTEETAWADEFEGKYAWLTFWSVIWIFFLLHARYTSEICESGIQNTRKSGIRSM